MSVSKPQTSLAIKHKSIIPNKCSLCLCERPSGYHRCDVLQWRRIKFESWRSMTTLQEQKHNIIPWSLNSSLQQKNCSRRLFNIPAILPNRNDSNFSRWRWFVPCRSCSGTELFIGALRDLGRSTNQSSSSVHIQCADCYQGPENGLAGGQPVSSSLQSRRWKFYLSLNYVSEANSAKFFHQSTRSRMPGMLHSQHRLFVMTDLAVAKDRSHTCRSRHPLRQLIDSLLHPQQRLAGRCQPHGSPIFTDWNRNHEEYDAHSCPNLLPREVRAWVITRLQCVSPKKWF